MMRYRRMLCGGVRRSFVSMSSCCHMRTTAGAQKKNLVDGCLSAILFRFIRRSAAGGGEAHVQVDDVEMVGLTNDISC